MAKNALLKLEDREIELPVVVELGTVVQRNGPESLAMAADRAFCDGGHFLCGAAGDFLDDPEACCPLNEGENTMVAVTSHDGVRLPVAELESALDLLGTL